MKNICAIYRTDRIGDFICSIPAIYAVRKMLPQHHITLVTNSQNAPIASFLPCIDEHRVYNPLQPFPFTTVDYAILLNEQGEEFYEAIKESTIYHRYGVWKTMSFFERWRSYSLRERTETEKMLHYVKSINPQLYEGISSLPECPILYSAEKKTIAEEILLPFLKDEKKIILISPIKEGASKVVADSLYPTILQMIHARFPQVGIVVIVSEFDKERGEAIMRALPKN